MYPGVISCNGETFDSVYAFIREYRIVMGPAHMHLMYLNGMKAGSETSLTLDTYADFRGCARIEKVTFKIKVLMDL